MRHSGVYRFHGSGMAFRIGPEGFFVFGFVRDVLSAVARFEEVNEWDGK